MPELSLSAAVTVVGEAPTVGHPRIEVTAVAGPDDGSTPTEPSSNRSGRGTNAVKMAGGRLQSVGLAMTMEGFVDRTQEPN